MRYLELEVQSVHDKVIALHTLAFLTELLVSVSLSPLLPTPVYLTISYSVSCSIQTFIYCSSEVLPSLHLDCLWSIANCGQMILTN